MLMNNAQDKSSLNVDSLFNKIQLNYAIFRNLNFVFNFMSQILLECVDKYIIYLIKKLKTLLTYHLSAL